MMMVSIIFKGSVSWSVILSIFAHCTVAQMLMATGSNFDSTLTVSVVDTVTNQVQGRSIRICGTGIEGCITTGYDQTQLSPSSFSVVRSETVVNVQSSAVDTMGQSVDVEVTEATKTMAAIWTTPIAIDASQNDTTLFPGNHIDII